MLAEPYAAFFFFLQNVENSSLIYDECEGSDDLYYISIANSLFLLALFVKILRFWDQESNCLRRIKRVHIDEAELNIIQLVTFRDDVCYRFNSWSLYTIWNAGRKCVRRQQSFRYLLLGSVAALQTLKCLFTIKKMSQFISLALQIDLGLECYHIFMARSRRSGRGSHGRVTFSYLAKK